MPSLSYTGMLMTENAFFLTFVCACFAIALTLERPTLLSQAFAVGGDRPDVRSPLPGARARGRLRRLRSLVKLGLDLRAPEVRGSGTWARSSCASGRPLLAGVVLAGGYVGYKAAQGAGLESGLGAYGGVVLVDYDLSNRFRLDRRPLRRAVVLGRRDPGQRVDPARRAACPRLAPRPRPSGHSLPSRPRRSCLS